jgi:hypothetical protein
MPSAVTKRQALKALAGMQEIVEHDMLIHGEYSTSFVVDHKLAAEGAICGGRKYCAVGALWVGGGVSMRNDGWDYALPGVNVYERENFLRPRHGLRLAYETLNQVAQEWAVRTRRANRLMDYYAVDLADLTIESVFEGEYDDRGEIGRRDMLRFIQAAGEKIEAM